MKLSDTGTLNDAQLEKIRTLAEGSLWQKEAADVLARAAADQASSDGLLQLMHEMARLDKIASAGLGNDAAFRTAYLAGDFPMWKDYTAPPADIALQLSLAEKLYNIRPGKNDIGLLNIGDGAREIGKYLAERCITENAPFVAEFADAAFTSLVMIHADDAGIQGLAASYLAKTDKVTRIMTARPGLAEKDYAHPPKEKAQAYSKATAPFHAKTGKGEVYYTLTVIPTRKDAEIDGIPYNDYIQLFFEMVDQPWAHINDAQKKLIEEFNAASRVRITNNDGTDVSMSLVDHDGKHFTFCNSLIAKNVPGSEIFSAPRVDSLEGIVVAKGRFTTHSGKVVEDLTMEFEKGRLVRYSAAKGQEAFEEEIGVDDGARFVGELGIGTNPWLKQHVANGLLVEKIGGSFHLALGHPYSYTEYEGVEVHVNNGNKSALHWDITTMLHGKEGRIYLDDRLVMENGRWVDETKYAVLNDGWAALPEAERPEYWKKRLAAKKPGI